MKNRRPLFLGLLPWLPAIAAAPFAAAFLFVALSRIGAPFELEWNEGQSAEQALRFALGEPLYPSPDKGWVPYMYGPLYHMVLGAVFKVAGAHLFWGRLISFASSIAAAAGIGWIVRERSRDPAAAWFAALLFFAYFKPSGFWYDIARTDAFALALTIWGMGFALSREGRSVHAAAGLALLALATLAKQTSGPVAAWCGIVLLARRHSALRWMAPLLAVAMLNFVVIFARSGNDWFWHYAVRNAMNHMSDSSVFAFVDGRPPRAWTEGVCNVWLFGVAGCAWLAFQLPAACRSMVRAFTRSEAGWTPSTQSFAIASCVALLAWGSLEGFAKFGGFRNNFLPMFGGISLLAGLAYADVLTALRREQRTFRAVASHACVLGIVAAQMAFPGNANSLFYSPHGQVPPPDSQMAHDRLMRWLKQSHADGEAVLVMHHQWYGLLAGHPSAPSVDMIRCATWAGDTVPQTMRDAIQSGRYRSVVLDSDLKWDWLAPGIPELIQASYGTARPLGIYEDLDPRAMVPLTGAPVRPAFVLERQ